MTKTLKRIKVMLVDDSSVQQNFIRSILQMDPTIDVIATATNGIAALELLQSLEPHVILMDLHMPKMNGIEAIRHIMLHKPIPIVAISSPDTLDEAINGFHALEEGALAFVEKPVGLQHQHFAAQAAYLLKTIQLMSEVKVVRRWHAKERHHPHAALPLAPSLPTQKIELIVIGVSTGGPLVLKTVLSLLSKTLPPVLIVQHIMPGFIEGLAMWLAQSTQQRVEIAQHKQQLLPGRIYLAPDHHYVEVLSNYVAKLHLTEEQADKFHSVDFLFDSVAKHVKSRALGVILTGMGSDGARGLKKMHDAGAVTLVQNKESSLIFGMPQQAIALNAADYVLDPTEIANVINELALWRK